MKNCTHALGAIQASQNQKQTNIGCLPKLEKLRIGSKIMVTVKKDIHDQLNICQILRNIKDLKLFPMQHL